MTFTTGDKKFMRNLLEEVLEYKLDEKFGEKFKERFGNLPTKDQLYEQNLKILKRLDDVEAQGKILSSRTYDNTDKIAKLEKIHPHNSHPTFA